MKAKVFFSGIKPKKFGDNLFKKLEALCDAVQIEKFFEKDDLTAVKVHFGEKGNLAYIRPPLMSSLIDRALSAGAKPFITDANTLYRGTRGNAVDHFNTAFFNGFGYDCLKVPVIIADGLRGTDYEPVKIDGVHFDSVKIATGIYYADSMICASHVKGHEMAGFGGAVKNLSMGCGSRAGKLQMHQDIKPRVSEEICISCGQCISVCPAAAVQIQGKAEINSEKCVGCGDCTVICPVEAIKIQWGQANLDATTKLQEKMAEYALGAVLNKRDKTVYFNFVTNVSPLCDCYGFNDIPIVPDIGILASHDPVAIDSASMDLINAQKSNPESKLGKELPPGEDKLRALYPEIDWNVQLDHAVKIGLGTRDYELVTI